MRIVLCYEIRNDHRLAIEAAGPDCQVVESNQSTIASDILDADIFCGHAKVPMPWQEVVAQGRLKWIQSSAAGLDHCLVPAVIQSPIDVSAACGLFRDQVAEQTMALLFGLVRRLPLFFRAPLTGDFARKPTDDLHGKRIGIVGFGGNGQRIAELLAPLGCPVTATDKFPDEWRSARELPSIDQILPADQLDRLLESSDVVILTTPLNSETRGMIGERELNLMPAGAYVINVGRGGVVQEDPLVSALKSGHLSGAGLDVTEVEPLPAGSPLWTMSNVIVTPHVGAQSARRAGQVTELFVENLARFRSGKRLMNRVDKSLGFSHPRDRN